MSLKPLGDRVVLKQLVAEETTKSGIVLPGQSKEKPQQAEVIAVGPGGVVDGKEVTMPDFVVSSAFNALITTLSPNGTNFILSSIPPPVRLPLRRPELVYDSCYYFPC